MNKKEELIKKLIESTKDKRISWKPSGNSGFCCNIGNTLIEISIQDSYRGSHYSSIKMLIMDRQLIMFDEQFSSTEAKELFEEARKSAYNTEQFIDKVIEYLKSL